jgi:hypothetical protein
MPRWPLTRVFTMLRQLYSHDELASFKRACYLLSRELNREGRDLEPLKAWRQAHATLRHTHLDYLILVRRRRTGTSPQL